MEQRPSFTLGIVEGFYGVFYTHPERVDLIRFAGQHGYNQYIYAPKNDRQQRARWWEPYPPRLMAEFAETVKTAQAAGVTFSYAISPGGSVSYHAPEDFTRLTGKLRAFYDIGARAFWLMLDDNQPGFRHATDGQVYRSLARAQADLANRLYAWLQTLAGECTLGFVPAEYSGQAPFSPALLELAARLHPNIDLCYTGNAICSKEITVEDVRSFTEAVGRAPLIWDNYPVNDLVMQSELHLGAVTGRAANLPGVIKGFLVNPMLQAEASKIPLLTYAAYAANPAGYDPAAVWEAALDEIAGTAYAAPLRVLAENTSTSCLGHAGEKLAWLASAALEELRRDCLDASAVHALEAYLSEIDEAGYVLKFRLENLALRNNLIPWIEVLEHWMWIARFGLGVLRAIAQGQSYQNGLSRMDEYREAIRTHPKRIATQALEPLIEFVYEQAARHTLPLEITKRLVSQPGDENDY